jgi:hypothetical protein
MFIQRHIDRIARAVATLAVWAVAFLIIVIHVFPYDVWGFAVALAVFALAALSTAAIWWCPRLAVGALPVRPEDPGAEPGTSASGAPAAGAMSRGFVLTALFSGVGAGVTIPAWLALFFGELQYRIVHISITPFLAAMLAIPGAILTILVLWHWKSRHIGAIPIVWPVLIVLLGWPYSIRLPGVVVVSVTYFFIHLLPDILQRGPYAPRTADPPDTPPPARPTRLLGPACLACGWGLILSGAFRAFHSSLALYLAWGQMPDIAPNYVGKEFTAHIRDVLLLLADMGQLMAVDCAVLVLTTVTGALLIHFGQEQRMKRIAGRRDN